MKWFKKYWYAVAVIFIPVTATAIYFLWHWYEKKRFVQPDTTNDPDTTDDTDMTPIDYRGRTDLDFGLQNNNPGNIRTTADKWQGKVGDNNGFVVFCSLRYGIRAAVKNIATLITTYGSIQAYISAYAPPSENDTQAYINCICDATGLLATDTPPLTHDMLKTLVIAHFDMENGQSMAGANIPDSEIEAGIALTPYGA